MSRKYPVTIHDSGAFAGMAIRVSYRGHIKSLMLVETFEDRLVDLTLESGGYTHIIREQLQFPHQQLLRGAMVSLAPGLADIGLVLSQEGQLLPGLIYEDGDLRVLRTPGCEGWCEIETHFAGVKGHLMTVFLLRAMKLKLFPELEVRDDTGFYDTLDLSQLRDHHARQQKDFSDWIDEASRQLLLCPYLQEQHAVSLKRDMERLILRPPEHPPVHFEGEAMPGDALAFGRECEWVESYKENIRKSESRMRAMKERQLEGAAADDALNQMLREEFEFQEAAGRQERFIETDDEDTWDTGASWDGSESGFDEDDEFEDDFEGDSDEDLDDGTELDVISRPPFRRREQHPLLQRASALAVRILEKPERKGEPFGGPFSCLSHGIMEISGGFSQALATYGGMGTAYGLKYIQFCRALQGTRHAQGALLPCRAKGLISDEDYIKLDKELREFEGEILKQMEESRNHLEK